MPLLDITIANVDRMEEVWRFDSGPGGLQTSPLAVNGVLCAVMPAWEVVALDAAIGNERWRTQIEDAGSLPENVAASSRRAASDRYRPIGGGELPVMLGEARASLALLLAARESAAAKCRVTCS